MDNEQKGKIAEFCSITGADSERAKFFMQAAAWDSGLAISTFFENESEASEHPTESHGSDAMDMATPSQLSTAGSAPPKSEQGRIQTFASWIGAAKAKEESDEDDQGEAYYAGGSDTSGQQILGPPRKDGKKKNITKELFKAAREHGAEDVSESDRGVKQQRAHFVGTGYRLGESESESSHAVAGVAASKKPITVVLKMWEKGFTLDDGPLRLFSDPNNRAFLQSIQKGEIPQELHTMADGGKVAVDMEDHSSEQYAPPKQPKVRAFGGAGQTLGSDNTPQPSTSAAAASACAAAASVSAAQTTVDPSLPVTNIQIRLADGSRLVAKFNHKHTVGDVRSHIVASRPEYAGVAFSLLTTLPNRRLTDDSLSLKDADLLNATIMQKL